MLHNRKFRDFLKSPKNIFATILFFLMLGGIGTGIYLSKKEKKEISKNEMKTCGKIRNIFTQNTRGKVCEYTFQVKGVEYSSFESVGKNNIKIGDVYTVKYSKKNPNYSVMSFISCLDTIGNR